MMDVIMKMQNQVTGLTRAMEYVYEELRVLNEESEKIKREINKLLKRSTDDSDQDEQSGGIG